MKLRLAGLLFATFFSLQSFAYSIDSAELTVDASKFYFDIVLSGITPTAARNGILRIHSEGDGIGSPNTEQIAVNFDTQTGAPIFGPHEVRTYDTPLFDRWQDGEIDSLLITANGAGSWRITGSVLHGTQPYVTGDILRDVHFRAFDGSNINLHMRDIAITAGATTYTVGGTTTGLIGSGLELQNNGADTLSVAADGGFVFAIELDDLSAYAVSVSNQPAGQTCSVSNGNGMIAAANVTDVAVDCIDDQVPPVIPEVPATPIPTLSEWALITLFLLLGLIVVSNRRRVF